MSAAWQFGSIRNLPSGRFRGITALTSELGRRVKTPWEFVDGDQPLPIEV